MHRAGTSYPPELLEWWCDWVVVLAENKHDARWLAVKSPEFRDWRDWQRDAEAIPVSGIEVKLAVCEHGICWACDGFDCSKCKEETPEMFELSDAILRSRDWSKGAADG
jgi:hypothetical protein